MPSGSVPANVALPLIINYESSGQNIRNYAFDATHTASGYYQITDSTWKAYGGTDTGYAHAIDAPYGVQTQVATNIYNQRGFADWAPYDPKLSNAINTGNYAVGDSTAQLVATHDGSIYDPSVNPSGNLGPQGDAVTAGSGLGDSPTASNVAGLVGEIATRAGVIIVGLVLLTVGLVWAMEAT